MRRLATAVLIAVTALACNSPAGPAGDTYVLVSINGSALPLVYPGVPTIEVTSGEVVLRQDGTLTEVLVIRCPTPMPAGTTCQVPPGGRLGRQGTYSRSGGWVRLANTEYATTFTNDTVVITFAAVSTGLPAAVLAYRLQVVD